MIGHNLAPAAVVTSALGSSTLSNASAFGRDLGTVNGYVVDDDTTRETREVTDDLGSDLGIKDWYSMHLMNICEGTYTPNATVSGAGLRATACTNMTTMCMLSPIRSRAFLAVRNFRLQSNSPF